METSEALHWTQQLQKIGMDPEQQLYTPNIENIATAVIETRISRWTLTRMDYDEYIKNHLDKIDRIRKLVINNTIKTQERMKKNYDKKHMERSY
ncbi:hypothetical protein LAZ67_13002700 [Cordylochernes scorpioides]|uniref:Uncharacterized protein n=1 Tax=Cordylochernes scorpioides TaxID=51811 RepID=A0ABY6L8P8_9ARAC|nr:hypothetical protein LAZ67_13002700 [Cordylochernes scorpioides]